MRTISKFSQSVFIHYVGLQWTYIESMSQWVGRWDVFAYANDMLISSLQRGVLMIAHVHWKLPECVLNMLAQVWCLLSPYLALLLFPVTQWNYWSVLPIFCNSLWAFLSCTKISFALLFHIHLLLFCIGVIKYFDFTIFIN